MSYLFHNFRKLFPKMSVKNITRVETEEIIKSLETTNSNGYDGISAKTLQYRSHIINIY
jgi:hypothetical protein